ncbi:MAG: transporter substrate-binding domain-containing protein [Rhodoferax sp.]|nr:transporter substrate-binding domain-containing protein [Rhodoferax sp.]
MKRPLPDLLLRALALCLIALPAGAQQSGAALSACASHTPPFVMFADEQPVGGFSYELLQALSRRMGRSLRVSALPWARCLQAVKAGDVDLAIDAYDDAERRKSYWYSSSYHTLTPQIFFKARSLIDTLQINQVRDLQRFRGCGVRDYTYEHYDLEATQLDRGAGDDLRMLQKLQAGHCDYAVEELEYIIGARSFVANWLDESGLKSMRPAWARGPQVHFLIGKGRAGGQDLLAELDQAIAGAEKAGQTAALRKQYFDPAYKPARKR